jgi:hypothetical protein
MKASITIDNIFNQNVAFKIKTTQPKFYVVKPNQGVLDKNQSIIIDITLQPNKPGQTIEQFLQETKIDDNKFLIEVAPTDLLSSEVN